MNRLGARVLVAVIAVGALLSTAAAANAETDSHRWVHGGWLGVEPIVITSAEVEGSITEATFKGTTIWTGDLSGKTIFTGRGTINSKTGIISARVDETFSGVIAHIGRGTLHFTEWLRQDATTGAVTVQARVLNGTRSFDDVRGTLRFVGSSNTQGIGGGTYTGHLTSEDQGDD